MSGPAGSRQDAIHPDHAGAIADARPPVVCLDRASRGGGRLPERSVDIGFHHLNGHELDGRKLTVTEARERTGGGARGARSY